MRGAISRDESRCGVFKAMSSCRSLWPRAESLDLTVSRSARMEDICVRVWRVAAVAAGTSKPNLRPLCSNTTGGDSTSTRAEADVRPHLPMDRSELLSFPAVANYADSLILHFRTWHWLGTLAFPESPWAPIQFCACLTSTPARFCSPNRMKERTSTTVPGIPRAAYWQFPQTRLQRFCCSIPSREPLFEHSKVTETR